MKDQILLINDLAGYGKVALSAMLPVMTHAGLNLYNLPTALVSNTLDYGKFEILETTEYMRKTMKVWAELGFSFDAVCTGFIASKEQVKLISGYLREQKKKGTWIFVDPIMGDEGKLYNGIEEKTVGYMRDLCSLADDCAEPDGSKLFGGYVSGKGSHYPGRGQRDSQKAQKAWCEIYRHHECKDGGRGFCFDL